MVPAGWAARRARRKVVAAAAVAAVAVVGVAGMPQASAAVNPLQALIDAAPDGATIDVPAGFYDGPLDFGGKAIHLRGPAVDPMLLSVESAVITAQGAPALLVSGGSTIEQLQIQVDDPGQPAIRTEPGHAGEVAVLATTVLGATPRVLHPTPIDAVDGGPPLHVERSQFMGAGDPGWCAAPWRPPSSTTLCSGSRTAPASRCSGRPTSRRR
ncbi:MAG: hypothetical protein R2699_03630 [Acidimicrobiales bacterium]